MQCFILLCCDSARTFVLHADLQLYIDGHCRGITTDQQEIIVRWANVLQWFSVRASWVHSIEIRNFSDDFAAQHDCPSGMATLHALQALYLSVMCMPFCHAILAFVSVL